MKIMPYSHGGEAEHGTYFYYFDSVLVNGGFENFSVSIPGIKSPRQVWQSEYDNIKDDLLMLQSPRNYWKFFHGKCFISLRIISCAVHLQILSNGVPVMAAVAVRKKSHHKCHT